MSYSKYLNDLVSTGGQFVNTALGRKEYFVDASGVVVETQPVPPTVDLSESLAATILIGGFLFNTLIWFIVGYGASRLSFCYNVFTGRSPTEAYLWAFLCFFFSGLYYPFYGIFLNPVCGKKIVRNNGL